VAEYQVDIEYVATDKMAADWLSRATINPPEEELSSMDKTINALIVESVRELPMSAEKLARSTRADPILSRPMNWIENGWPARAAENEQELERFRQQKEGLHCCNGVVMFGARVVIPVGLRQTVLSELHQCHQGMARMKSAARLHVFWPGITEDIESVVRGCQECQAWGPATAEVEVQPTPWPQEPWSMLNIDLAGPIAGKTLLIVVDQMSKWLEVAILKRTDSTTIIEELRKMFASFGMPRTIMADNATYFQSEEMRQFCAHNGIRLAASAPYHPRTNGLAERNVQSVKAALSKMKDGTTSMQTTISRYLCAQHNTPQTTTGMTPAELLCGRKLRTRLDAMKPSAQENVFRNQERINRGRQAPEFLVGDQVFAREFPRSTGTPRYVRGTIVDRRGNFSYVIRLTTGAEIHRHVDHLKMAHDPPPQQQIAPEPNMVSQPPRQTVPSGNSRGRHYETGSFREDAWTSAALDASRRVGFAPQPTNQAGTSKLKLTAPFMEVRLPSSSVSFRPQITSTPARAKRWIWTLARPHHES
jgi:hypothetical protein